MAPARRKRGQTTGVTREPVMSQPIMTAEDHPRTTISEGSMSNRGNTSFTTRTQVGRRIYNGSMQNERAPDVRHYQQRNMSMRSLSESQSANQPPNLIQNNVMENQPGVYHRIESEFMSIGFEQEDEEDMGNEDQSEEKITRGPTYMQSIWGRPLTLPLIHVEYNEFGQPIGGEHSTLCHFLGSIARNGKYCPIDVKNWHAMPMAKKREMLDVVKLRFHVPVIAEKWVLSSIGCKWRNWKHFLKTRYWADVPIEHLIDEKDDRVLHEQWVRLLTYWRTDEAKKESDINKRAREKKRMDQRTGKTSFAQIKERLTKEKGRPPTRVELFGSCFVSPNGNSSREISSTYVAMQERSNQLQDGAEDVIAPNDIFAQIMGKDKPGQVRMLGQGICPSDIWSGTPRSTSNALIMEQQAQIEKLKALLRTQQQSLTSQVNSRQDVSNFYPRSAHTTTNVTLQVGTYVSLQSLFTDKIVAKGCIHSTEPTTKVGGQMLGENWCEVIVKVIVEPEEQLLRPYDNFLKLSQMLDKMIAWPSSLVTPTES